MIGECVRMMFKLFFVLIFREINNFLDSYLVIQLRSSVLFMFGRIVLSSLSPLLSSAVTNTHLLFTRLFHEQYLRLDSSGRGIDVHSWIIYLFFSFSR